MMRRKGSDLGIFHGERPSLEGIFLRITCKLQSCNHQISNLHVGVVHGPPVLESSGKGIENAEFLGSTQELANQKFSREGPRNLQLILMHTQVLDPLLYSFAFLKSFLSFQSQNNIFSYSSEYHLGRPGEVFT